MHYATYIFPLEKKIKVKKKEEAVEVMTKKHHRKRHASGTGQGKDDISTKEKIARAEAHLTELRNKIDRLTNENNILQEYLDERPDLKFNTIKTCCLLQNEDLFNWTNKFNKLVKDYEDMPEVLRQKQENLDNLKKEYHGYLTDYEGLEEREHLTKQLKERAVIFNKEIENETNNIRNMQDRLTWMEDYHKVQLNGEIAKLRKQQEKEKFAIRYYSKLCEELEANLSIKSSTQIPEPIVEPETYQGRRLDCRELAGIN